MNEMQVISGGEVVEAKSATVEMATSRQAQEVQAAMVVAKRFPRDEDIAYSRIMKACKRQSLAETAVYEYRRGGQVVTGPSIRLAEVLAQNWGNIDYGLIEMEQRNGESQVMAYAWDLETNVRQTKIFTVPHFRSTKSGGYALTDPRDIYETVASQGARRVRSCILGVVPKDIVDEAVSACAQTLKSGKEPISDRVRKMISIFQENFGVSKEALEKFAGCNTDAFTEQTLLSLGRIYTALKDGAAKREDYFEIGKPEATNKEDKTTESEKKPKKSAEKQVSMGDL